MDIQEYNEAIANADMAVANDNLETALEWFEKALVQQPEDIYALSRAGAICTALDKYEESYGYFEKAMEVDPENGDNVFNMGNAHFFRGDISRAVEMYSAAELKPCSDDVKAKIYYQLAMCAMLKEDYKTALVNFQKYQDADTTGTAMADPDVISEKIKIYMVLDDTENAIKHALQWINVSPSELRCYMVYFNLLLAVGEYGRASEALVDAERYADYDEEGKFSIDVSRASLYVAAAGSEADTDGDLDQKAYDLIGELIVSPYGSAEQKNDLVIAMSELCMKLGKLDEAIDTANMLLGNGAEDEPAQVIGEQTNVTEEEILAQMDHDMQIMDAKIAEGEIDEAIGDAADVNYDENGQPIRSYPDGAFEGEKVKTVDGIEADDAAEPEEVSRDYADRAEFIILSCYAMKEEYDKVLEIGGILKNSENSYYSYFGKYSEAFALMKLAGDDAAKEEAARRYEEIIAFFRSEMMKKEENAPYAVIFRARMYAELGKYAKAEEMASLMNDIDRASVMEYIAECRKEQEGS